MGAAEERKSGIVAGIVPEKSFGWISVDGQEQQFFFHHTAMRTGDFKSLKPGDRVNFTAVSTERGPRAVGVEKE